MAAKQKQNRIGARTLSDSEAKMILPTYTRIFEQVEQFRREQPEKQEQNDESQKTNNIGIIGVRGAGKTSLLKTIRRHYEQSVDRNKNDILLPIIVPENMSESGTLMSAVLGALEKVVNERKEKEEKARTGNGCILSETHMCYQNALRQYTYIQKEYRDILLRDCTSEGDYVQRSSKIFNSDTEFIQKFNALVSQLVYHDNKKGMLFLFVDDIDLSTYRCADVVKTLLSYLANPNIVTFISGDLETFEEALTLDFLRRDNLLRGDVMNTSMLADQNQNVLESKKKLTYEYLKKILPPAYRHQIRHWSLSERGNYRVDSDGGNNPGGSGGGAGRTLSGLLSEALRDWVEPAYFHNQTLTYHLFDSTSRGLNNVYNVLEDIASKREGNPDVECRLEKKLLIDTIVASSTCFNQYRNDILQRIILIGESKQDSRVLFDNAKEIIYRKKVKISEGKALETYAIKPQERFSLFLLVDFAARLLYGGDYARIVGANKDYRELKRNAMEDLFYHPDIAEKVMETYLGSWLDIKEKPYAWNLQLSDVNIGFMTKGNFVLNLMYYKHLSADVIRELWQCMYAEKPYNRDDSSVTCRQNVAQAFWRAVCETADAETTEKEAADSRIQELLAEVYPVLWKEFYYFQSYISNSAVDNTVSRLFEEECKEAAGNLSGEFQNRNLDQKFWMPYGDAMGFAPEEPQTLKTSSIITRVAEKLKRIWINTIIFYLKEGNYNAQTIPEQVRNTDGFEWKPKLFLYKNETDVKKRIQWIRQICDKKLWNREAAELVKEYLENHLNRDLFTIGKELLVEKKSYSDWQIYAKPLGEAWKCFVTSDDGITHTKAKQVKENIIDILCDTKEESGNAGEQQPLPEDITEWVKSGLTFVQYLRIERKLIELAGNNRVWYGRYEAQEFLNCLWKLPATAAGDNQNQFRQEIEYFMFRLQCIRRYKLEEQRQEMEDSQNINNLEEISKELEEFIKALSESHKKADQNAQDDFLSELNAGIPDGETLDSEQFNKLFGTAGKTGEAR